MLLEIIHRGKLRYKFFELTGRNFVNIFMKNCTISEIFETTKLSLKIYNSIILNDSSVN